jgi:hypothetical protein
MPIKFTGGEGAIGGDGPVADQCVKKNAAPAYAAPKAAPRNRRIGSHRGVRRGFPTRGALHIVGS